VKKVLILTAAAAFAASAAFAALGDVVTSFRAPKPRPIALAKSSSALGLWVFCDASPYRIYQLNANNGSVVRSFVSPLTSYTRGLTYRFNSVLYAGNYATNYIYQMNCYGGSIYSSFYAQHDMDGGLALEGDAGGTNPKALFASKIIPHPIYRQSYSNGSIYSSFTPIVGLGVDLAWDYKNNLIWGGGHFFVYGVTKSGSLVTSFHMPAEYPAGMAYYNNYLWIGTTSNQYIWKVHCPGNITVEPTSFGKVKALFR